MIDASMGEQPRAAPNLDPEALAIRQRPMRAIRFKRGVVIGIAALGSVSLMAVTFFVLQPQVFRTVAVREQRSVPSTARAIRTRMRSHRKRHPIRSPQAASSPPASSPDSTRTCPDWSQRR